MIVQAPMGGGPSTPELAAAVSNAGGIGFLAAGYKTPEQVKDEIDGTRALTDKPFGVNVFVPSEPSDPAVYSDYVASLGPDAGEPRHDDDHWDAKLELLEREMPAIVSFTFGCPPREVVQDLSSEVWVTVTTPAEAAAAQAAGADALVAQGIEAGAHRGSFADDDDQEAYGLLALLQLLRARTTLPLVATGGIATAAGVAAVLAAGATHAQLGTAFLLCPEAGTSEPHRQALRESRPTALTRAFTGRTARGIRNRFMDEHEDAPQAYPEIHYATAPIRAQARKANDSDNLNLWAGQAYELTEELPAGDLVRKLYEALSARSISS
jgi:nitronate monooxygenase